MQEMIHIEGFAYPGILALLSLFGPLLTLIILILPLRMSSRWASGIALLGISASVMCCTLIAWEFGLTGQERSIFSLAWFQLSSSTENISLYFSLGVDSRSLLMGLTVSIISLLVHLYSLDYLNTEKKLRRYWFLLALFTASMLGIVWFDNLLWVFICWELVGLSSYLLIGFWHQKAEAAYGSQLAFVMNRIGDAALLLAILILFYQAGSLEMSEILKLGLITDDLAWQSQANALGREPMSSEWHIALGVFLFIGVASKSAQFPLQVWLPRAMAGPTPVSALIHAATMVAAGVYLLSRVYVLLAPLVLDIIAGIGVLTAFLAALSATRQWDIKAVLAYSTISQLGYMIMGIGLRAWDWALFHLFTHACFKAALFLLAGAVTYTLSPALQGDKQDLRKMGSLRHTNPLLFYLYLPPALSIMGFPFFSGFLSKEGLLDATLHGTNFPGFYNTLIVILAFGTSMLTAFYMSRHALLIFWGEPRWSGEMPSKSPGKWMLITIAILSLSSFAFLFSLDPFDGRYFRDIIRMEGSIRHIHPPLWLPIVSTILLLSGMLFAFWRYKSGRMLAVESYERDWLMQYFFIETFWNRIGKIILSFAAKCDWVDRYLIDSIVRFIGALFAHDNKMLPSLSSISAWFDRVFIDGLVLSLSGSLLMPGKLLRKSAGGRLQVYLVLMILILLCFGVYWIIFLG